jgi:hypothetical protein
MMCNFGIAVAAVRAVTDPALSRDWSDLPPALSVGCRWLALSLVHSRLHE